MRLGDPQTVDGENRVEQAHSCYPARPCSDRAETRSARRSPGGPAQVGRVPRALPLALALLLLRGVSGNCATPGERTSVPPITVVHEDFSRDPGWEGFNNRVECKECPLVRQDFGWAPTNRTGFGPGEIGGTIWRSTTPAYYGMPIGPLSFKDRFSASGKIVLIAPPEEAVGFYVGFFGSERQGWRVWSSCGFRIGKVENGEAYIHLDYKTGRAKGAVLEPDIQIPCDGSVHSWELTYDPDAVPGDHWPDPRLPKWIGPGSNVPEEDILRRARRDDPSITAERLHELLIQARNEGLVDHWFWKHKYQLWEIEKEIDRMRGRITFRLDDLPPVSYYLLPGHREEPTKIDRFGVWNMQVYHGSMEFYIADLVVNGERIELDQDPHWDGLNNHVSFVQRDFHARQNFGYSQTNWAGRAPGEIGGRFWGTEVIDPLHAYYAVDVGRLTLDDPISFSGWICFVDGAVDGRMLIGYFNREARLVEIHGEYKGNPPDQFLGIEIMDQTRIGYSFTAVCSPRQEIAFEKRGPIYIPDRVKRPFSFRYDPNAGVAGRITVTLGEESFHADLTVEQREVGATFDRFGLLNPRKGGKYVDVYVDDLTYVVRRPEGYRPPFLRQGTVIVPYPKGGRLYE